MDIRSDRRIAIVALDVVVVVGLVLVGMVQHGTIDQPTRVVGTVTPFLAGWLVAAPLTGLYDGPVGELSLSSLGTAVSLRRAAATWLGAANVGLVLRSSPVLPGGTAWAFPAVITLVGLVGLVGWRGLAVAVGR